MRRRVVITGMGVITPLGCDVDGLFAALVAGRSGVGPIQSFDASTFPTRFAAEVHDFDLGRYVARPERYAAAGRNTCFALAAAREALADAGLLDDSRVDRTRFGVYLGAGEGEQEFSCLISLVAGSYLKETRSLDGAAFAARGLREYHAGREYEQELHTAPARVADCFGLDGPNYGCLTACAAGAQAIGEAAEWVRDGGADLMLTGGCHSMIHPIGVTAFARMTALSQRNDDPQGASRPFDRGRDGVVLGEGAGMVVVEELQHARRRGAVIHAELTGYGATADAYRVTDSHPEGRGAAACMRRALADAGLAADAVDYVNAHGTSTQVNDKAETAALKAVFGEAAYRIPVSSTKSMLGHQIAAAGAVEVVVCVEAIRRGVVPPTINYQTPDPACDLDFVPNACRERRVRHALSNSFGFGGQNVSLIVSRFMD
jgi:3-oxoacyl-[acyl-carrier-protein] synthase II